MEEKFGWIDIDFKISCEKISLNNIKIQQKNYLPRGNYPVVDQGQELIGGYCDDSSLVVPEEPPFIIYGDHTKVKKYINFKFVAGADGVKVLKPNAFYNPKLFFYFIHSIKIPDKGYARHFQYLEKSSIPLPPLPEQRAIVSKIEQLFSELDNGISDLKLAQEQLKVYRQAVLKKAFEGELTKKWREQQIDLPDAKDLLEQIRREREKTKKIAGKEMILENSITGSKMAELPEKWVWTRAEELGEVTGGLTKNSKRNKMSATLPYLRVANVYSNELRLDELKYIGIEPQEIQRVLLKVGDLLVVEGNGSIDQIGRVALWDGKISPCVHQNHIIKVRFQTVEIGKFVLYWLLSFEGRNQITKAASSTSGLYTLSISKVASLCIPLPPLLEQQAIVQEIETRLSVCDKIEQDIETNLEKAEALRQSILKKAFEGKLLNEKELAEVRGAEDWEPAEVLLERIKAEKTGNSNKEKQVTEKMKSIIQDDKRLIQQATLQAFEQIDK